MTGRALIRKMSPFEGKQLIAAYDEIKVICEGDGFTVNVIDPKFNTASIDNDKKRLNVRTDKDSVITSFTIG
jgi:hypothetical protein